MSTTSQQPQSDAKEDVVGTPGEIREIFPMPDTEWPEDRGFEQRMDAQVGCQITVRVAGLNNDWEIIPSAPLEPLQIQRGENSTVTFKATAEGKYRVEFYADKIHKMAIVIRACSE